MPEPVNLILSTTNHSLRKYCAKLDHSIIWKNDAATGSYELVRIAERNAARKVRVYVYFHAEEEHEPEPRVPGGH